MQRFTTPTKTIHVEGIDLTPYDMIVSIRQTVRGRPNAHEVDIGLSDLTVTTDGTDTFVTFGLTQLQTGGFVAGPVEAQVNYGAGDARMGTAVCAFDMERNLLTGEVEFATGTAPDTDEDEVAVTIGTMPPLGSITSAYLADGAVETNNVADGTITNRKLDPNGIIADVATLMGMRLGLVEDGEDMRVAIIYDEGGE